MKNIRGQSLFEVVVAIAISALVITAVVAVATNSIRNSTFTKNQSQASAYAQQLLEWLRGQRDNNIQQFLGYVDKDAPFTGSSTWCFPELSWTSPSKPTYGTLYGSSSVCDPGNENSKIVGTNFMREATFTPSYPTTGNPPRTLTVITVDVVVHWVDSQGDHKIINTTDFSDWRQR